MSKSLPTRRLVDVITFARESCRFPDPRRLTQRIQ